MSRARISVPDATPPEGHRQNMPRRYAWAGKTCACGRYLPNYNLSGVCSACSWKAIQAAKAEQEKSGA